VLDKSNQLTTANLLPLLQVTMSVTMMQPTVTAGQ
jgi:hypothetical protein